VAERRIEGRRDGERNGLTLMRSKCGAVKDEGSAIHHVDLLAVVENRIILGMSK
jgi:hypothetical protein